MKSNRMIIKFVCMWLLCHASFAQNPQPTQSYANTLTLQQPDSLYLYWQVVNQTVTFELHFKNTSQWVMFGISGATFSDVIVAWLYPDTTGHFSNRILTTNGNQVQLTMSPYLNNELQDAFAENNYYVIKFSRPLLTGCLNLSNFSVDITTGQNTLVFATGVAYNLADDSITISSVSTIKADLLQNVNGPFFCVPPTPMPEIDSPPSVNYPNQVDLIQGVYRLYWDFNDTDFTGEIHVKTSGWVGFGLSPSGAMDASNVVVGWVTPNGAANFTDRFIKGMSLNINKNQSWRLLNYGQSNGYTWFRFTRKILLCDSTHITISVSLYFHKNIVKFI
jgi:hypothetical protein